MRCMKTMLGIGLALITNTAAAALPELDWLAGKWCGGEAGRWIDEVWLPEAGGMLVGMSRTLEGGKVRNFELMRIVTAGDATQLHVQPDGGPATMFPAVGRGDGWIRFALPSIEFPNQIEYRRGDNGLRAWIAGPDEHGNEVRIPFEYRRCSG